LSVDVANLTWPGPHSSSSQSLRTSGEIVFRVTGWFDGKGIRKNFPTRAEASAERQALGIQRVQAETGILTSATRLRTRPLVDWDEARS
jgi:hypothetical protein